ncbi:MAG TPA: hypothetical protein VGM54_21435 [Chthoniobacter sp.]|jgi:hypothetical protein
MSAQKLCEEDKARSLAEEYRLGGYEVIFEPAPDAIPGFDPGMRPDFLARKNDDRVVVEVKSRNSLRESDDVRRMADALARTPGWRFELVLVEDSASEPGQTAETNSLREQLSAADFLLKEGQQASAFILAWIAAESLLRRIALAHGPQIEDAKDASPIRLIRELAFNGLIAREDYDLLAQQCELRNRLVHGFKAPTLTVRNVEQLRDLASRLIALCEGQTAAA